MTPFWHDDPGFGEALLAGVVECTLYSSTDGLLSQFARLVFREGLQQGGRALRPQWTCQRAWGTGPSGRVDITGGARQPAASARTLLTNQTRFTPISTKGERYS